MDEAPFAAQPIVRELFGRTGGGAETSGKSTATRGSAKQVEDRGRLNYSLGWPTVEVLVVLVHLEQ